MNPLLEDILTTERVKTADGQERQLAAAISREEGMHLQQAISTCDAVRTLEVGLCYGLSTLFICEAIKHKQGARHIVIDPNQSRDFERIGLNNIQSAGYTDIVEFHERSSHVVLPELQAKGVEIDFAFIDASHLFDYTLLEFFYIDLILKIGGILAFDDANMPAVRKVCRFIATNRRYRVIDCIPAAVSQQQQWKYLLASKACRILPLLKKLMRPELQEPEIDYGLIPGAKYVAFRKEMNDSENIRPWNFYREF